MKQDILEIFIPVMSMRPPAAGMQINFHVARAWNVAADLQKSVTKIRAAFEAGESGMNDADVFPVRSFKRVAAKPLMQPDRLKQAFGREMLIA